MKIWPPYISMTVRVRFSRRVKISIGFRVRVMVSIRFMIVVD